MSMPTSALRDLNLGQMPETRSKTKLAQLQRGRNPTNHSRGRGSSHQASTRALITPPENAGSLESKPISSLCLTEGSMLSELCVDRLQRHDSPSGAYYAFQLKRPISVRIFSPENGERKMIECTCEDHQKNHSFCSHISWLLDGLKAVLTDQPRSLDDPRSEPGVLPNISNLYSRIGERVESLPQQLNRLTGDAATDSSSENSATEEIQVSSRDMTNSRQEIVKDILSVFDPKALPGEYGVNSHHQKDEVVRAIARASESEKSPYVPGNLAATIYEIAISDEAFYRRLRKVVTRDICAKSYFQKQKLRAREVMSRLDDRFAMMKGPPSEPGQPNVIKKKEEDLDVPECARIIQLIVHQICTEREARTSKGGPLEAQTSMNAAKILVDILADVVYNHDEDLYHQSEQNDIDEPRRNRNLYLYLIGDPPPPSSKNIPSTSAPAPAPPFGIGILGDNNNDDDDFFIISRMIRSFPPSVWSHLLERLTNILDHILEKSTSSSTTTEGRESKAFARKLDSILREYTETEEVFEPSTSSNLRRRPMTSPTTPARQQRRRYI